jgi:hypothetical protein
MGSNYAAGNGMVTASVNYMATADDHFKEFYGGGHLFTELKAGVNVARQLYLWAGFGFLSASGTTPVLQLDAKASQRFLSAGLGYRFKLSPKFRYKAEAGIFLVNYKEEAMGDEISDSAVGFRLDNALVYQLSPLFSIEFSLGFLTASDSIEDEPVRLGGFKTGIGVGVTF